MKDKKRETRRDYAWRSLYGGTTSAGTAIRKAANNVAKAFADTGMKHLADSIAHSVGNFVDSSSEDDTLRFSAVCTRILQLVHQTELTQFSWIVTTKKVNKKCHEIGEAVGVGALVMCIPLFVSQIRVKIINSEMTQEDKETSMSFAEDMFDLILSMATASMDKSDSILTQKERLFIVQLVEKNSNLITQTSASVVIPEEVFEEDEEEYED